MGKTIGSLNEKSLHLDLKNWYAQPGDILEDEIEGFVIDLVRGDLLIEIQSRSFSKLKHKLKRLCKNYHVHLVYPIAQQKWIVRVDANGKEISRRKSPLKGRTEDMFKELMYIPEIASHPNFSFEVLIIHAEEILQDDGKGSWRRKGWSIADRKLIDVLENHIFLAPEDYTSLLPIAIRKSFTNKELVKELHINSKVAQKMTYCLRKMGYLKIIGNQGRAYLFSVV